MTSEHFSALGRKGGQASAGVMREKREQKWQAQYGVSATVGRPIYDAGFQAGYQSAKRRYQRSGDAPVRP